MYLDIIIPLKADWLRFCMYEGNISWEKTRLKNIIVKTRIIFKIIKRMTSDKFDICQSVNAVTTGLASALCILT